MKTSDRDDRKRRRPKPRNRARRRSFLFRPWFLKLLLIEIAPLATRVAEIVIEIIKIFRK